MMEAFVFLGAALMVLGGAGGVVMLKNPIHCAISLVGTLFGVAVLFVAQEANFLAAVQVIVYAGAIVVLFLFVIMLLGVDQAEDLDIEPIAGQRRMASFGAMSLFGMITLSLLLTRSFSNELIGEPRVATGIRSVVGPLPDVPALDVSALGGALFTRYLCAFEITSVLLIVAVVGAVVLSRKPPAGTVRPIDRDAVDHEHSV